jgi:hypothetical protein
MNCQLDFVSAHGVIWGPHDRLDCLRCYNHADEVVLFCTSGAMACPATTGLLYSEGLDKALEGGLDLYSYFCADSETPRPDALLLVIRMQVRGAS